MASTSVPTVAEHRKAAEVAAEQQAVDAAYARLAELRVQAKARLAAAYHEADTGTASALVDRDAMVFQTARRAGALDAADDGLVFGRLDLANGETLYIGRIGIRTTEHESMVIDWRAPAAEAFYRATAEDPRGVVRRRVLHCRGDRVIDISDDLLDPNSPRAAGMTLVGDGAFLAELARTRDGGMRDIVATIQREQDEVVRAPADATVVLRGGPGTGKTAVALHRVAYLLFRHARRFGNRGVLVVGPSRRFMRYIERVLPSLGTGGATLRSLGSLAAGVEATGHDPAELAAIKGSAAMAALLRRAVAHQGPGAPGELTVSHRGVVLTLDRAVLRRIRERVGRTARRPPNRSRPVARRALLDELWRRLGEVGVSTDRLDRAEFDAELWERSGLPEFLSDWWPLRTPTDVLAMLGDPAVTRRLARGAAPRDRIDELAASWRRATATGAYTYADVALLDELDRLLGRAPKPRRPREDEEPSGVAELTSAVERMAAAGRRDESPTDEQEPSGSAEYAHIVVDEAQDCSPMQWRMLARRGRHATWTVVTDAAQSAWPDPDAAGRAMETALGTRRRLEYELTTNYRNPAEIAAVAARVLRRAAPAAIPARAVRPGGRPPRVEVVDAATPGGLDAAVARFAGELLDAVDGTVAVIADARYRGLPDVDRLLAVEPLEAKGLEFDAALIVAPERIAAAAGPGMRTVYVALTRPTGRLTVLTTDPRWARLLLGAG